MPNGTYVVNLILLKVGRLHPLAVQKSSSSDRFLTNRLIRSTIKKNDLCNILQAVIKSSFQIHPFVLHRDVHWVLPCYFPGEKNKKALGCASRKVRRMHLWNKGVDTETTCTYIHQEVQASKSQNSGSCDIDNVRSQCTDVCTTSLKSLIGHLTLHSAYQRGLWLLHAHGVDSVLCGIWH